MVGEEVSPDEAFLYGFLDSSPMYFYQINSPVVRSSPCHSTPNDGVTFLPEKAIVFKLNNKLKKDTRSAGG